MGCPPPLRTTSTRKRREKLYTRLVCLCPESASLPPTAFLSLSLSPISGGVYRTWRRRKRKILPPALSFLEEGESEPRRRSRESGRTNKDCCCCCCMCAHNSLSLLEPGLFFLLSSKPSSSVVLQRRIVKHVRPYILRVPAHDASSSPYVLSNFLLSRGAPRKRRRTFLPLS